MKSGLHCCFTYLLLVSLLRAIDAVDAKERRGVGSIETSAIDLLARDVAEEEYPPIEYPHGQALEPTPSLTQDQLVDIFADDTDEADDGEQVDDNDYNYDDVNDNDNQDDTETDNDDGLDFDEFLYDLRISLNTEDDEQNQNDQEQTSQRNPEEEGDDIGEEELPLDDEDEETMATEFRNLHNGDPFQPPAHDSHRAPASPWSDNKNGVDEQGNRLVERPSGLHWQLFLVVVLVFFMYRVYCMPRTRQISYNGSQEWRKRFKMDTHRLPVYKQDLAS